MSLQQRVYIPVSNVSSNGHELKVMRQKMLMQQYDKEIQYKYARNHQTSNPEELLHNYTGIRDQPKQIERSFKRLLANEYQQEIKRKQAIKKMAQQQKRLQQTEILQRSASLQQAQKSYLMDANKKYQIQVQSDIMNRQQAKRQLQQRVRQEKQYFKRHFSQANIGTEKQRSFQQYYAKLQQQREVIEKNYIQQTAPSMRQRDMQKERIINRGIINSDIRLQREIERQSYALANRKYDLRDSLLQQIRQKQETKRNESRISRLQNYTEEEYTKLHHPIYNPVDFKMSHDNRYIMQEIGGKGPNTHRRQISDLARSGSQSLLG